MPYFKVSSPVGKTPWKASPMIIPNLIANAVLHQFKSDSLFQELVQFTKKITKIRRDQAMLGVTSSTTTLNFRTK